MIFGLNLGGPTSASNVTRALLVRLQCGSAAAQCGKAAPFRPGLFQFLGGYASSTEAQPQKDLKASVRKGRAFPHCAAAKPQAESHDDSVSEKGRAASKIHEAALVPQRRERFQTS
jgi:hypothetical protein